MINFLLIALAAGHLVSVSENEVSVGSDEVYLAALDCAETVARDATFQRRNIYAVAEDAAKMCATEIEAASQYLRNRVGDQSPDSSKTATEYVGAVVRAAAWSAIIRRLENGDEVAVPNGLQPELGEHEVRFIECSRSAGGIKVSSIFIGDAWLSETLKRPKSEQISIFSEVGRSSCPVTYRSMIEAVERAAKGKNRAEREALEVEIASVEALAAETWLPKAQ